MKNISRCMENKKQNKPFAVQKEENIWDMYKNGYVIIFPPNQQHTYGGKLIEIKDGHGLLNPWQAIIYDKVKGAIRKLVKTNKPMIIPLRDAVIEPTTRKNLENACLIVNKAEKEIKKLGNLKSYQ